MSQEDQAALDKAFDALKTYDYGAARADLIPIDDAVAACGDDAKRRRALEGRLLAALKTNLPQPAKDYLCRKIALIGSDESAPLLAELLPDKNLSLPARAALERIPGSKTAKALRDGLSKTKGLQKAGVIQSLGVRRDAESVAALAALLRDPDLQIAGAAAAALGNIASEDAANTLRDFVSKSPDAMRPALADACLACAERMLTAKKGRQARALYEALAKIPLPKHIAPAVQRRQAAGGT